MSMTRRVWSRRMLQPSLAWIGLFGLAVGLLMAGWMLGTVAWDPTGLARFSAAAEPYAEEMLGIEVIVAPAAGHDGKFFFALANDPWLVEPEVHGVRLDDPPYRARRILYPMLAGGFGLFAPSTVIWALIAVNVAAIGLGVLSTGGLARAMGLSPWFGLAFAANPGVFYELAIDGSSILGWSLAAGGLWAAERRRPLLAGLAFAGAALARETMILVALGTALWLLYKGRSGGFRVVAVPLTALLSWSAYSSWRLQEIDPAFSAAERNLGLPLTGLIDVVGSWLYGSATTLALAVLMMGSCAVVFISALWRRSLLSWGVAGFALLPVFATPAVLSEMFDATRVVMPVFTAALLLVVQGTDADSITPSAVGTEI